MATSSIPKHIVRLIGLVCAFLALALIAKWYFTPDSFYRYGHYRADSVPEIAAQEPAFQTPRYCQACHSDRHAQWSANSHKSVICEVCHGAAQGHPQNGKLPIPKDSRKLCTLCHETMPGRPRTQPQIDLARHSAAQQCTVCHNPHAPKIVAAAAKAAGDAAAGQKRAADCAGLPCAAARGEKPAADAAAGKTLAKNCAACHGDTGIASNPAWPSLAGQQPGFLVNALKAFRAGLRKDPMMSGVTRGLSDADIANLAAYYAGQSCRPTKEGGKNP